MNVTKAKITTTTVSGLTGLIFLAAAAATAANGDSSKEADHPFGPAEQKQATELCAGEQAGAQIISLLHSADTQSPDAGNNVMVTIDRYALNACIAEAKEKHNKAFETMQTRNNIEKTYKWLGGVGFAFAFTMGAHMLLSRKRDEDEEQHAQTQASPAPVA